MSTLAQAPEEQAQRGLGPPSDANYRVDSWLRQADAHVEAGRNIDAIRLLLRALPWAVGSQRTRVRIQLGRCYMTDPEWLRHAEEQLRVASQEAPDCAEAWYWLGVLYRRVGLRQRARSAFQKALWLDPAHRLAAGELGPEEPSSWKGLVKLLTPC